MKKEFFALIILILLPVLGLMALSGLTGLAEDINSELSKAQELAISDSWAEAESAVRSAISMWKSADGFTHILLHHRDIDEVTATMYSALGSIYRQDKSGVKSTVELLSEQLYDICELERVRLGSVF